MLKPNIVENGKVNLQFSFCYSFWLSGLFATTISRWRLKIFKRIFGDCLLRVQEYGRGLEIKTPEYHGDWKLNCLDIYLPLTFCLAPSEDISSQENTSPKNSQKKCFFFVFFDKNSKTTFNKLMSIHPTSPKLELKNSDNKRRPKFP